MFSDAISSISWRCRPSSPRIAPAISGSACSRVAVKNESGAEAAREEAWDGGGMGEELHRRKALGAARAVKVAVGSGVSPISISGRSGQALAADGYHLCKMWWDA